MNLKKLVSLLDLIPNCASPRKKVVSGFGLGFVSFFIFLFMLFSNFSFISPISNKLFFQGFTISNNTSLIAWSISFSSTSSLNSTYSSSTTAIFVDNATQIAQNPKILVTENRTESNSSNVDISLKLLGFDDKANTHLGNFTDNVKNVSFHGISAKVVEYEDTHLINGTFSSAIAQENADTSVKSDGLDLNLTSRNTSDDKGDGISKKVGFVDADTGTNSHILRSYSGSFKECDIFDGRWVKDDSKPYYPAGSCPYVDRDFNCHLNHRPDDDFVKWRWQPFGCEIPSLNATDFLERLRGKKLVFVGDSLNRNMWESLVCILRHSLKNKNRVYEISGKSEFKKKGIYAFRFEDYNCTVDFVGSPFLVRESSFKGRNGSFETLRLDLMDRTTSMYHDADVLIFNTGHWWTHDKTSRGEDYYQEGKHVYPRLKALDAYTRALSTWARWVDKNIDTQKTLVLFRGYSLTHFRGGQWNSGGQCHKETQPIFNTSHLTKYPSKMRSVENVVRMMKTPVIYLNISRLTDYRKDGHPSIYRRMYTKSLSPEQQMAAEQSQDCSHWCLPGVPDTWNELLYASLLKLGTGSWET
ncbi:protein trichome birefringence-like 2 [Lactuca sativa]|uniref:protein trichome birefringence-like 2 n=1 Tax=Lactuca sativa TaxID=4236 RepID=UPI000CD8BF4B|nr:protein trichome birefringence-like 2 [Lactuca sativa]